MSPFCTLNVSTHCLLSSTVPDEESAGFGFVSQCVVFLYTLVAFKISLFYLTLNNLSIIYLRNICLCVCACACQGTYVLFCFAVTSWGNLFCLVLSKLLELWFSVCVNSRKFLAIFSSNIYLTLFSLFFFWDAITNISGHLLLSPGYFVLT